MVTCKLATLRHRFWSVVSGAEIPLNAVRIAGGLLLPHPHGVVVHPEAVIGPNCLGVLNTEPGTSMDATFAPPYPPHGSVAFSSQSGALGLAILEYATALNIGISHFVSVGNKADVSGNDLLEFW